MADDDFVAFVEPHVRRGYSEILHLMKTLVYASVPTLFDLLTFDADSAFLDPLLFAFFNSPDPPLGLEQILFGYIPEQRRPATVTVHTDDTGICYLPNIGYLLTGRPSARLTLTWDAGHIYALRDGNAFVPFTFAPPLFVDGTSIELYRHNNPLLAAFFCDADRMLIDVETEQPALQHLEHLNQAFGTIKLLSPALYALIVKVTRNIAVFDSAGRLNSFAALSAHGAAFLNARASDDEVFFLEDIAHQCGHILCNTATFARQRYFQVDPDMPLSRSTGDHREGRSVYVAFHGVFTEVLMNLLLVACHNNGHLRGGQGHELAGRLALIMRRFIVDLECLKGEGLLTHEGITFRRHFEAALLAIYEQLGHVLTLYDISNQPYNFSYAKLLELNPLPEAL